jgi:hypothetical protein
MDQPDSKPSNHRTKLIAGCCGSCSLVLVVLLLLAATALFRAQRSIPQADATARQFLEGIRDNSPERAYPFTSDRFKQVCSLSELKKWMGRWREDTGTMGTITRDGERAYTGTDGSHIWLGYRVEGSVSVQQANLVLSSSGAGYRVDSCTFAPYTGDQQRQ